MEWNDLHATLLSACIKNKYTESEVDEFMDYCHNLFSKGLPIITTPTHLASLIGLETEYLMRMAYSSHSFYRTFKIPKKNGDFREINEPLPDLKFVQNWILVNILKNMRISPFAKAFVEGKGIRDNARFHKHQKQVLCLDIHDFFTHIYIGSIVNIFENVGYSHQIACLLAYLCCYKGHLPQGAPTSPYLSNLYMFSFDNAISCYALKRKIRYTRYADDMTFSGNFKVSPLIEFVKKKLYFSGLRLNDDKTRLLTNNKRQEVTGVVVNSYKLSAPREYRRHVRQELYYIKKYGLDSHLDKLGDTHCHYLNHLLGKINYILYLDRDNTEYRDYYKYILSLMRSYQEYDI